MIDSLFPRFSSYCKRKEAFRGNETLFCSFVRTCHILLCFGLVVQIIAHIFRVCQRKNALGGVVSIDVVV